jgi:hypothetical protein
MAGFDGGLGELTGLPDWMLTLMGVAFFVSVAKLTQYAASGRPVPNIFYTLFSPVPTNAKRRNNFTDLVPGVILIGPFSVGILLSLSHFAGVDGHSIRNNALAVVAGILCAWAVMATLRQTEFSKLLLMPALEAKFEHALGMKSKSC